MHSESELQNVSYRRRGQDRAAVLVELPWTPLAPMAKHEVGRARGADSYR